MTAVGEARQVSRLRDVIRADLDRFDQSRWRTLLVEPQHRWLVRYRIADACTNRVLRKALSLYVRRVGRRFGYTIPLGVLGEALRLPHAGTIAINGAGRVGRNCQIYQGVTIGSNHRGAPTIGDDVFIGPNVTIIGPVIVGDRITIAAGSNIRSDIPSDSIRAAVDDARIRHAEHETSHG
jgi:serine O-acetyltransferase